METVDPATRVERRRLDAGRRGAADAPERLSGARTKGVVERTIGWLTTKRRLAKDDERLVESGDMLLYLAMCRILLRRLTRKERKLLINRKRCSRRTLHSHV
jgi:hypothetical protein